MPTKFETTRLYVQDGYEEGGDGAPVMDGYDVVETADGYDVSCFHVPLHHAKNLRMFLYRANFSIYMGEQGLYSHSASHLASLIDSRERMKRLLQSIDESSEDEPYDKIIDRNIFR